MTYIFDPRAALAVLVATLAGCAQDQRQPEDFERSTADTPTFVQPYEPVDRTLRCIRETGALRGVTFVVGSFADSTGKINASAPGATGNFVPQGGTAAYIMRSWEWVEARREISALMREARQSMRMICG